MVFKMAFEQNATTIILTHNHPSGKLEPSNEDLELTKKLKIAGQQLDIPVLDHIIVTENGYYSFKDNEKI
jgi:DNA repair protein RadC